MYFKRKAYDRLLEWKAKYSDKYAALLEGAKRVGKSTIAESFGQNEYKSYLLIDVSKTTDNIRSCFEDVGNLNMFFLRLQAETGVTLYEHESLIIFDEVQLFPQARQAIKHLVADGRYSYLETGSLISIKKNVKDILIPSEEMKIQVYPMDYEEFCDATGGNYELLRQIYGTGSAIGQATNRKLMRDLRIYMAVGGMPQAVEAYTEGKNFSEIDMVKRQIISLYEDDFKKIDATGKLSLLFDSIPAQLNKNASRYQVSSVLSNERADTILELIAELKDSKTVLVSYHANDPNAGMATNKDLSKFKLFLCDTGLFTTLMFKDKDFTENIIYEKLLNDKLGTNLGYLYENVVAQLLHSNGNELFYHTFMNKTSHHNYEVDFLLAQKNKVCPIEVKSSGYKTHKSLDAFSLKYSDRILQKYLVYTKDFCKDGDIICLPIYMVPFINQSSFRSPFG